MRFAAVTEIIPKMLRRHAEEIKQRSQQENKSDDQCSCVMAKAIKQKAELSAQHTATRHFCTVHPKLGGAELLSL